MRRSGLWLAFQIAVVAIVAWFVGRSFLAQWDEFREYPLSLGTHPGRLLLAALVIWGAYAILIAAWRGVVVGWGERLGGWQAARIWALSSLGKYVPGKVWAVAGMVVMSQRAGVKPLAAVGSAVVMQLLALATGSVVVATTGAAALDQAGEGLRAGLIGLFVVSVTGIVILLKPWWLKWILNRLPGGLTLDVTGLPSRASIIRGAVANVLAWCAYGVAVWLLAGALLPDATFPLVETVGAFAAAYLIGFLVVLVPGGLGVREGVFVLMMQGVAGLAPATALAVASRLLFTLTEIGIAVPFLVTPKGMPRGTD